MSGSWGADFGAGLWGSLDREAQDFQKRRIARKEEERKKRLAEEERLRQEALANQRAENIFEMNNQSLDPIYDAAGQVGMVPYANLAVQKLLGQAGANGSTVGGIMNAQQDILNQKAYDDQQKKEEQERKLNDYNQNIRDFNLWKNENAMHEYEELQALKPKLEAEAEAEKARKAKMEQEKHNAYIANMESQTKYHTAQANYWNNGGRSAGSRDNGKVQEQIDPEEQKFINAEKAYEEQIKKISKEIEMYDGDSRGYESTSFDKADASKNKAVALRDKRQELIAARDANQRKWQEWKNNKEKPAAKSGSTGMPFEGFFNNVIMPILTGIGNSFQKKQERDKKLTKIEEDFYKEEAEKAKREKLAAETQKAKREKLAAEAQKASPMSDYDRLREERGEMYGNIGRGISNWFSRGKKAVTDYFNRQNAAYAQAKAQEALRNPAKAQLDALYKQGKISRNEYMRKLQEING